MIAKQCRSVFEALKTILVGMRITLKYNFARTVTVQYPQMPPTLQPRFRGFHYYLIDRCTACKACQRACPVDCIYIEHDGVRKMDKESGCVRGGAVKRWAIDYSKCMFCGLCTEVCAMDCLMMGNVHDNSVYDRDSTIVEFTDLARSGLQTPQPLWMRKARLPEWAAAVKREWEDKGEPRREEMIKQLSNQPFPKPAPAAPAAAPATPAATATADPPPKKDPPPAEI